MTIGRIVILWIVIIVGVFLCWSLFQTTKSSAQLITFSAFLDLVDHDMVERVVIRGTDIAGCTRANGANVRRQFRTVGPGNYPALVDRLRARNVLMAFETPNDSPFLTALITWAPVIFLIGLWRFLAKRAA